MLRQDLRRDVRSDALLHSGDELRDSLAAPPARRQDVQATYRSLVSTASVRTLRDLNVGRMHSAVEFESQSVAQLEQVGRQLSA